MISGYQGGLRQAEALAMALGPQFQVNYQPNNAYFGFVDSVVDAYMEKMGEDPSGLSDTFVFWLETLGRLAPSSFLLQAIADTMIPDTDVGIWSQADLSRMSAKIKQSLTRDDKVVFVAHSQGNFFYRNVLQELRRWNAQKTADCFTGIGFGTPLTDSGLLGHYWHINNSNDYIIGAVQAAWPGVFEDNVRVPFTLSDLTGHSFLETYLGSQYSVGPFKDRLSLATAHLDQNCHQCIEALSDAGGQGDSVQTHVMTGEARPVRILFEAFNVPDELEITANGRTLVDTRGTVSGYHEWTVDYDPFRHGRTLDITVRAPNPGTYWELCIDCDENTCGSSSTLPVVQRESVTYSLDLGHVWNCSSEPVEIDQHTYPANATVKLTAGTHRFSLPGCYCENSRAFICESLTNRPTLLITDPRGPLFTRFFEILSPTDILIGNPTGPVE